MRRMTLFLLIITLLATPSILQAREDIPVVSPSQFAKPLEKAIIKGVPVSAAVRTQIPIVVPGGGKKKENRIFISWMGVNDAIGYNIYRKDIKNKTLNLKMITPVTDGNAIQNIIRIDSAEWPAIKQALGISDPSQFFYDPPLINQNFQVQGNQFSTSPQLNTGSGNSGATQINPNNSGQPVQLLPGQSGSTGSGAQQFNPDPMVPVIPGEQISSRALTRWALAQLYASVARVMGVGYLDTYELKEGKKYEYEVRAVMSAQSGGLNKKKTPITLFQEMRLTKEPLEVKCEDSRKKLTSPKEFTVYEGDQYLEILWSKDPDALAYDIWKSDGKTAYRKLNVVPLTSVYHAPNSIPSKVLNSPVLDNNNPDNQYKTPENLKNSKPMAYYIDQTIMNPGDPKANPPVEPSVAYLVKNDQTYQYKVYPRDIMGPGYEPQKLVKATPQDRLEPASPTLLSFETLTAEWELPAVQHNPKYPCLCKSGSCTGCAHCNPNNDYLKIPAAHTKYSYNSGLRIRWKQVLYNIKGNPENIASYTLYRYPTQAEASLDNEKSKNRVRVGTFIVPKIYSVLNQYIDDNPLKSETKYYYRLYVTDKKGHSNKSGIFTASVRDNKPPLAPENVHTTVTGEMGKTAFIKIHWDPGKDPDGDLAGYRVYRRVAGAKPAKVKIHEQKVGDKDKVILYRDDDLFRLVGVVYHNPKKPAQKLEFEDQSLPQPVNPIASGLVYQYCVKAFDRNENVSYNTPSNITCQRQQKIAGPKPPTITFLQSRSNSIRLEWVAPPVPDPGVPD